MSKNKVRKSDIIISGGGIAGLTLAVLLGHAGLKVNLAEPFPPEPLKKTKATGRTVALMQSSLKIIQATGAWDAVSAEAGALRAMRIIDDSRAEGAPVQSDFPATEIGLEEFGFNIPNTLLRAALYEECQKHRLINLHNAKLVKYTAGNFKVSAELENGMEIRTPLIVGADGRGSPVRRQAGIECKTRKYGQNALTCLINHSKDHENISTEFHRPGGPLALVPLPGRRSSVVWVEREAKAEKLIALKKQDFENALQKAMNEILGDITLETGPECWPLMSLKAERLTGARMALCAEAAHVLSPITAQGLNLSLRDIAALAETITEAARLGLDTGSNAVLARYERRRRLDISTRSFGVDFINRMVAQDAGLIKSARRLGLKTLGALPPLKALATRTALAPDINRNI